MEGSNERLRRVIIITVINLRTIQSRERKLLRDEDEKESLRDQGLTVSLVHWLRMALRPATIRDMCILESK